MWLVTRLLLAAIAFAVALSAPANEPTGITTQPRSPPKPRAPRGPATVTGIERAKAPITIAPAPAVALTLSANAQQLKDLTYEQVKVIAETAYETCAAQGLHVSVHVVGRGGETLFAIRGDGAESNIREQPAQGVCNTYAAGFRN